MGSVFADRAVVVGAKEQVRSRGNFGHGATQDSVLNEVVQVFSDLSKRGCVCAQPNEWPMELEVGEGMHDFKSSAPRVRPPYWFG